MQQGTTADSALVQSLGSRILYFDTLGLYRYSTEMLLGTNMELLTHYKEASYHYKEAALTDNSLPALEGLARCQIATRNFDACLKTLARADSVTTNIMFLKACAWYGIGQMDSSEHLLLSIASGADSQTLHRWYRWAARNEKLNPRIARNLSFILPGLGQFYAGDIKNGINAMALNALLIWGFVHTWRVYTFWDSYLSVFPWMQRYYLGSALHAKEIAEQKKAARKSRYFQQILLAARLTSAKAH